MTEIMIETIDGALSRLNKREQCVVRLRFGLSPYDDVDRIRTWQEVAQKVGCGVARSPERMRQICDRALKKLRVNECHMPALRELLGFI